MCSTCGCGDEAHEHPDSYPYRPRLSQPAANRAWLAQQGILALNLVSSPGSGKTTLLVKTIEALRGRLPIAVIEGDQHTERDAERIHSAGAPAVQINTGRSCHLDATQAIAFARQVNPALEVIRLSANNGAGMAEWLAWIWKAVTAR